MQVKHSKPSLCGLTEYVGSRRQEPPGKGQAEKPGKRESPSMPAQDESLDELEPHIEDHLTRAKATHVHPETDLKI